MHFCVLLQLACVSVHQKYYTAAAAATAAAVTASTASTATTAV
jgi:hypothetical protein